MMTRTLILFIVAAATLAVTTTAHADRESDQNDRHLGVIERALDKFQKKPALFDGKTVAPGSSLRDVSTHMGQCTNVIRQHQKYWRQVSSKGKQTERAQKVLSRVEELEPWCQALATAGDAYIHDSKEQAKAIKAAQAKVKATCDALRLDAMRAFSNPVYLFEVLDTWAGTRTPVSADHVVAFRGHLETLVGVCDKPEYRDVVAACKGQGVMGSSATNRRFDHGDICAPAADPKATLTAVAMRLLDHLASRGATKLPTLKSFRSAKGWLHETAAVSYKSYFTVSEDKKQAHMVHVKAAFDAAGVAPPDDLSALWAKQQEYLDALKAAVDGTAGEWETARGKCKGYACNLAKKAIVKHHKSAAQKAVYADSWKISKNALGVPLERYQDVRVVYQVRGEPFCQVRTVTVHEPYKGGGKYERAKGAGYGYVRFQTSCK